MLLREELMWRQRSRTTWLKEGDKNTKYFQQKATWRRKKNTITRLKDGNGQWVEDKEGIQQMTTRFFKDLYTKDDKVAPQELIDMMQARVNEDMNNMLTKDFTEKEISDALFQIGPLKAPGPDGFPARFYQRNWDILKEDVVGAVKNFFADGIMPEGINDTTIVLIPKVENPEKITQYSPISLCNIVYKLCRRSSPTSSNAYWGRSFLTIKALSSRAGCSQITRCWPTRCHPF